MLTAAAAAVSDPDRIARFSPQAAVLAREIRATLPLAAPDAAANDEPAQAAVPVEAATVARKDFPVVLESLGQVAPYNTVTVKARVDGQVTRIAFKEGQDVTKGEFLAEIDPRPFAAALDQATAKQQQDEANLANAKADLARYSTLAKQSFASQQQVDTQKALVNQDTALVAGDIAAIDAANVQLSFTKITAPLTGRVGFRLIDQGNMASGSQQTGIVVINELQPIAVTFTAPEERVGEINALMRSGDVKVVVKSTDGKPLASGVLEVVNNQIDAATGTVQLKARFANSDNHLWPGLAVLVDLTLGVDKQAIVVPTDAVKHGAKGLYVYVIDENDKAQPRPVQIKYQNMQEAAIASGLNAGDKLVTAGQSRLRPGQLVAIRPADSRS
ncbi:MAG: efflux RND transporter periplasmic adaptor subunit [Pseudomonadota bacterium]|nr:efflux RND transporter periplasmic adaptor subunit [Pseudomonadota bacterium]